MLRLLKTNINSYTQPRIKLPCLEVIIFISYISTDIDFNLLVLVKVFRNTESASFWSGNNIKAPAIFEPSTAL